MDIAIECKEPLGLSTQQIPEKANVENIERLQWGVNACRTDVSKFHPKYAAKQALSLTFWSLERPYSRD